MPPVERQAPLTGDAYPADPGAQDPDPPTLGSAALDPLAGAIERLRTGELSVEGRLVSASNATLYCRVLAPDAEAARTRSGEADDEVELACVYKPIAGERPLWDFPTGTLAAREVAAYEVSRVTGWNLVPPTILRDGPFGPGMCQVWVEHDEQDLVDVVPQGSTPRGWHSVVEAQDGAGDPVTLVHADDPDLRRTAVLDAVINNADRKGGHLLPGPIGLRVVDHGVCFHVDPKLRTVLWGWAGSRLREEETRVLQHVQQELAGELGTRLAELLDPDEVEVTAERIDRLLRRGRLPRPSEGWPSLPWPPF